MELAGRCADAEAVAFADMAYHRAIPADHVILANRRRLRIRSEAPRPKLINPRLQSEIPRFGCRFLPISECARPISGIRAASAEGAANGKSFLRYAVNHATLRVFRVGASR